MVPWSRLRKVDLDFSSEDLWGYDSDEFTHVLALSPGLQELNIVGSFAIPGHSLTHTSLESLSIHAEFFEVLEDLTLPSLLNLELRQLEGFAGMDSIVLHFLSRSPNLKKLTIIDPQDFPFLSSIPPQNNITQFHFVIPAVQCITYVAYQSLVDIEPHHLPSLEVLSVELTSQDVADDVGQTLPIVECLQAVVRRFKLAGRQIKFDFSIEEAGMHEFTLEAFESFKELCIPDVDITFW